MQVAIVGNTEKREVKSLKHAIESAGGSAVVIDPTQFPGAPEFSIGVSTDATTQAPHLNSAVGTQLDFSTIGSCYIDSQGFTAVAERFQTDLENNFYPTYMQIREHAGVLQNILLLLSDTGTTFVNSFSSLNMETQKIRQLHTVDQSAIHIPDTIATNSPDRGDEFIASHDQVIVKPVTGGGKAHRLTPEQWEQKRDRLSHSPVQIQEYIPGTDLRVYYTEDEIISASYFKTTETDYRRDPDLEITPAPITPAIQDCVESVSTELEAGFGAIDIVERDSEYYFLEVNVAPLFAEYSDQTGTDVAEELATHLLNIAGSEPETQ